jgi:hypothetical protein
MEKFMNQKIDECLLQKMTLSFLIFIFLDGTASKLFGLINFFLQRDENWDKIWNIYSFLKRTLRFMPNYMIYTI